MKEFSHPDATLERILSSRIMFGEVKYRLQAVHELCRARYASGARSFQPTEIALELFAESIMAVSTYLNSKTPPYSEIGMSWQEYADSVELGLDPNAPLDHPDAVLVQLLSNPKRRGNASANMRALYKLCKDRFNRGELNFSSAAVLREAKAAGILYSSSSFSKRPQGEVHYVHLLQAWQALADKRGPISLDDVNDPEEVLQYRLRERGLKFSTVEQLQGLQQVCETRFNLGEYDFGTTAMAKALSAAGVFVAEPTLGWRLKNNERWYSVLQAWQSRADALWIDGDPDLPPTNPHSVFRRLRAKAGRADKLQTLLGVHRVCYLEHAAGQKDFSTLVVGRLLAARGLLAERSLYNSIYEDLRILTNSWDEYARPWLAKEGEPPPQVEPLRTKHHDPKLEWIRREYPQLEEWRELASEWLQKAKGGLGHRIASINAFFELYLAKEDVPNSPAELLRRGSSFVDPSSLMSKASTTGARNTRNNDLWEFFNWTLLKNFSAQADDGELVVPPLSGIRSPVLKDVVEGARPLNLCGQRFLMDIFTSCGVCLHPA